MHEDLKYSTDSTELQDDKFCTRRLLHGIFLHKCKQKKNTNIRLGVAVKLK